MADSMILRRIYENLLRIALLISLQNLQASICAAVVYGNDLYFIQRLGNQAVQTGGKIFFNIINRYDDAYLKKIHPISSF